MKRFEMGQVVKLATNPDILFEIVDVNSLDNTYEIRMKVEQSFSLYYQNIAAEMLFLIES
ncbi:hypothetical protein [Acinetobacter stercoris]|uniref:Uncharacterized protein n=1 Tax=Acinetobacter stercoris TaxID=2126983 RepID=A0A2U3N045_9GAMM|nr:hypothetical protein [Acinetobacter stercoris]SPL71046.1 hypothetical protein KPC_2224 [Acinetobacter stercoris]